MAKRKKLDRLYAETLADEGFVEGLPPIQEYLSRYRAELNEVLAATGLKKRADIKAKAAAAKCLFRIDIIETNPNPVYLFKAILELGLGLGYVRRLQRHQQQGAKGGNSKRILTDSEAESLQKVFAAALVDSPKKQSTAIRAVQSESKRRFGKTLSRTTARNELGLSDS